MTSIPAALVSCAFVLMALPAGAQTHLASLRGVVTDPAQLPLGGVEIRVEHEGTNETRSATSGPEGRFTLALLPPGQHRLVAEAAGYKRYVRSVALRVNEDVWVEVALEVGAITEAVTVLAPYVLLEKDSSELRTVVDGSQVTGLPLDGRNYLDLALLVPGAAPAAQGSAGSVRGDFAFNVNGAREDANSFLLDGVYNIDPKLNSFGVRPPVDAIREFEVLTSTADATFGRNAGGQVNVITRSGTNRVDGTAYEFFRYQSLNARNYFAPGGEPDPEYLRHQYGVSIGGPIARDRTFFFADYEGTRLKEGVTRVTNVPTIAERNGDFSQSLFRAPINPFTQQPFPDTRIPVQFQHPVGRAIAALYPEPNRAAPFANYVASPTLTDDQDQFDLRLDVTIAAGSSLTARYSFGDRR
ncbi:MAG: carboxypeptidase regulatory-like domain-containing protein, partial [Acidobacteria bacterium]|nr:carboxypeptidase regulatory-like domain-containing protein [Acidobacteriota bacterium]